MAGARAGCTLRRGTSRRAEPSGVPERRSAAARSGVQWRLLCADQRREGALKLTSAPMQRRGAQQRCCTFPAIQLSNPSARRSRASANDCIERQTAPALQRSLHAAELLTICG